MKELASTVDIDRNLRNLTVGNESKVTHYDLSKAAAAWNLASDLMGRLVDKDLEGVLTRPTDKHTRDPLS